MPLPLTASCCSKIQIGFTFLVPAHLGSPRKRAVKRVCVCTCNFRKILLTVECQLLNSWHSLLLAEKVAEKTDDVVACFGLWDYTTSDWDYDLRWSSTAPFQPSQDAGQHRWTITSTGSSPLHKGKKTAHTRLQSVGFRSWSRFLTVSLQVTWVINLAVGCHYFPPGLQLPSQPLRGLLPISLHDGCKQSA